MLTFDIAPQPIGAAVAKISAKTPIGSALRSREWAEVPLALRERAQFSAGVESARVLQTIQDKLVASIGQVKEQVAHGEAFVDRSSFVRDLRRIALEEGLGDGTGRITDISSQARLRMIFDMQTDQAYGFARWKSSQQPGALDAFPAWRFVRVESRSRPRSDWGTRWVEACRAADDPAALRAFMQSGRMVALKGSDVWEKLSRFGTPWPPFDYSSGMGLENVDRTEAERLSLIKPQEEQRPPQEKFNRNLEASAAGLDASFVEQLKNVFGSQLLQQGARLVWRALAA